MSASCELSLRQRIVQRAPFAILGVLLLSTASISWSQPAAKKDDVPPVKKDDAPPAKKDMAPAKKNPAKLEAPPVPPQALLKNDAWKGISTAPLAPGEIDGLLDKEFQANKIVPSPLTTDEQFLRRVRLDLTGQLPALAEIEQFVADKSADKRAKLIDKLLETDDYARHWANYWRDTIAAVDAPSGKFYLSHFENWLYEQFKQDLKWNEIVRKMLTADGTLQRVDKGDTNGGIFFLGRFNGPDGDIGRTSETARVFLGIQIQCAQCHDDRRTKIWHQTQFHELAGFFSRMNIQGSAGTSIKIVEKKNGEHKMPGKDDKQEFITYPRFLDGKAPAPSLGDAERRKALADYLTSTENYWFSAAFVNRMSSEMLGQGFYERVDDLSPKSEIVFPEVANRLAASFRGSNYEIKPLLRAIANSKAYQRQVRLGDSLGDHLKFAAVYPARISSDVLWQSLAKVLVKLPSDENSIKAFVSEFGFDPSLKADEIAGSMGQALWLLNNELINERLKVADVSLPAKKNAKGPNTPEPTLLKKLLSKNPADDSAALRELYLQTLARKPTDKELQTCLAYVKETKDASGKREDAFEDVFKALINSTEFQRK